MPAIDPYILLSVPRDVTLEVLKRSYRKLMLKFHPDKAGPAGHVKSQQIIAAYEEILMRLETGQPLDGDDASLTEVFEAIMEEERQRAELEGKARNLKNYLAKFVSEIAGMSDRQKRDALANQLEDLEDCLRAFVPLPSTIYRDEREEQEESESEPYWRYILRLRRRQADKQRIWESLIEDVEKLRREVFDEPSDDGAEEIKDPSLVDDVEQEPIDASITSQAEHVRREVTRI